MTALYIIIGIVLLFVFILSLKAKVKLEYDEILRLSVKILCFNIQIAPKKEPKPLDFSGYSFKKHQKRLRENYEKYLKKKKKKEAKKEKKAEEKEKKAEQKRIAKEKNIPKQPTRSIFDWVEIAKAVIGALFSKFANHLHIKVARLNIKVATGDAATTAIVYGAVIQSVAYIIEILQKITNVDGLEKADISVEPDYLSESTTLDLCFVFSLRIWHVLHILFGTLGRAIKKFFETSPNKQSPSNDIYQTRRKKRVNNKKSIKNNK